MRATMQHIMFWPEDFGLLYANKQEDVMSVEHKSNPLPSGRGGVNVIRIDEWKVGKAAARDRQERAERQELEDYLVRIVLQPGGPTQFQMEQARRAAAEAVQEFNLEK